MAEFEELRIHVKVDSKEGKAEDNIRQLHEAFGAAADPRQIERFQALGRLFKLTDEQIKKLAETVGNSNKGFAAFASAFAKGGTVLGVMAVVYEAAMMVHEKFASVATKMLATSSAARRLGVHPRQLEEDVQALERVNVSRDNAIAMLLKFGGSMDDLRKQRSDLQRNLEATFRPEYLPVLRQHLRQLLGAPNIESQVELALKFADELEKWEINEAPGGGNAEERARRGARRKREYLETVFGSADIARLKTALVIVSEDAKKAWDANEKAAAEYIQVTKDIKNAIDDLIGHVIQITIDDLGVGEALRGLDFGLRQMNEPVFGKEEVARAKAIADALIEENKKDWAARGALSIPARQWRILQAQAEIAKMYLKALGYNLGTYLTPDELKPGAPMPRPGESGHGHMLKFLEDLDANQTAIVIEERRLVDNIAQLNLLLSGDATGSPRDDAKRNFGANFHNRPLGGAAGESDPIRLPAGEAQPGGGAAAESAMTPRRDRGITRAWPRSVDYEGMVKRFAILDAEKDVASRRLEARLIANKPSIGRVAAAADPMTRLGLMRSNVESYQSLRDRGPTPSQIEGMTGTYGYSTPYMEKPQIYYDTSQRYSTVTLAHEGGHVGRAIVDQSINRAPNLYRRYGIGRWIMDKGSGEEDAQRVRDMSTAYKLAQSGVISEVEMGERWRRNLPYLEKMKPGQRERIERQEQFYDRRAEQLIKHRFSGRTGEPIVVNEPEYGPEYGERGRARIDREIANELDVSGRLNVRVDAPRGTTVRATGGGMFENGVTLDRSLPQDEAR